MIARPYLCRDCLRKIITHKQGKLPERCEICRWKHSRKAAVARRAAKKGAS